MTPSRVHEVRRDVPAVRPGAFLDLGAGGPRGFWASGDRWLAHAGLVGSVRTDEGRGRFDRAQSDAVGLFARIAAPAGRPPRLFGGFSFAAARPLEPAWASFPPALFHLPEVEIEHDPVADACSLMVRAPTRAEAERRWRRWADGLRRASRDRLDGLAAGGANGSANGVHVGNGVPLRIRLGTDQPVWTRLVEGALRRIRAGEAEKIVLARTLDVASPSPVDGADLAAALWRENHGSHVFLFEPQPGDALVGAAPETIATLAGGVVRATAVAGSTGVGRDSVETARLAAGLLASEKDRAEHDLVVRHVVKRLKALGCPVRRDVAPHVLALARIQHLETKIAGPAPPGMSVLRMVASQHPTPAVCGTPGDVAMSAILEDEAFDRGWYSGPVGWFDAAGDGIFVPALRSAVRFGGCWRLFAGAGIVARSDPALEWEETDLKFRPVLKAIAGVAARGERRAWDAAARRALALAGSG